jgi:3-deoxy-D-manno-octulosonic-acid transferase
MAQVKRKNWQLRTYLAARTLLQPTMRWVLKRRLDQGKEDPGRVREKLGESSLSRPDGSLVWMHAVGLGEVMALRPLLVAMQAIQPDLNFLLTSTARSSARVIGANLPPRTVHQFLPLDGPKFMKGFLDHWQPDLSIWSEQDLWPGAICDAADRGIPLAYVNVRLSADAVARRARVQGLYGDMLSRFALISAQDAQSATAIHALGGRVNRPNCNLKPAAEPLAADQEVLNAFKKTLTGRAVWVAASTHAADEAVAIAAHALRLAMDPAALLILVPRIPGRAPEIGAALKAAGLTFVTRSSGDMPDGAMQVFLADSFGELGLWYRLARHAFIGASFGGLGGHNPWEAICLGVPVLAGPNTDNFRNDYKILIDKKLCRFLAPDDTAAEKLACAFSEEEILIARNLATKIVNEARASIAPIARDLVSMMGPHQ